jgi:16S rRNA G527 N7-methylase RsmG
MIIRTEVVSFDVESILQLIEPADALVRYLDCLMEENRKVNLVSRETSREDLRRLAAESLLPLSVLGPSFTTYLDIGSGGGFPSVPILLTGRVAGEACLVERTKKKAAALRRILGRLGLRAAVFAATAENMEPAFECSLATLRYVKLTRPLLAKVMAWLEPGGQLVRYSVPDFDTIPFPAVSYMFAAQSVEVSKHFTVFEKC